MKLTDAFQPILTADRGRRIVSVIHLANVTNSPKSFSVCDCLSTATPTIDSALIWDFTIPANDIFEFGDGIIINQSFNLFAKASENNAGNITISLR